MPNKEVTITRVLDAPREEVWKTWTDPERLKLWWGPKNYTAPVINNDFHVGGKYLFAMLSPEGQMIWSTGTYKEIRYLEKIVATDSFSDEKGNIVPSSQYGMQGMNDVLLLTVDFEDQGNKTKLTIHHKDFPAEMVDMCMTGWNESLDKLEDVVKPFTKGVEMNL
ncbi:MAG: SRPBCC family protein [Bdellovibrio sp.]